MRTLPEDPHRRRIQQFRRLYQYLPHWREQIIAGSMTDIITIPDTGEDVYYQDLLVGQERLSPRQRQAFDLICLQGYTETAAAEVMKADSLGSTNVQQHVSVALERMVAAYDEYQSGIFRLIKRWKGLMSMHPTVKKHLSGALQAAQEDLNNELRDLCQEEQRIKGEKSKTKAAMDQVAQMMGQEPPVEPPAEPEEASPAEEQVVA